MENISYPTRKTFEGQEAQVLSPYACLSSYSQGRQYNIEEHPWRMVFSRDRDRIIHSTAFRRLEYKTQVFVNHEGDYYRTRLTHSLEVAQIARSVSRYLMLNNDLTEAIALAHDLGHTPFGHAGEDALRELMRDNGGFEHNQQSLRVVEILESRYPDHQGLNLTFEVREGIVKHRSKVVSEQVSRFEPDKNPTLEAQIVDISDEIAYNSHDLDDGLMAGFLTLDQIMENRLWREVYESVSDGNPGMDKQHLVFATVRGLINRQVQDMVDTIHENFKSSGIRDYEDIRSADKWLAEFSPEMQQKNQELKKFLFDNLYRHYRVAAMTNKARRYLNDIFEIYNDDVQQLPPPFQTRIENGEGKERVVCDYIAGMTDRFAQDEYKRLFMPFERM
jgi:dGTPase